MHGSCDVLLPCGGLRESDSDGGIIQALRIAIVLSCFTFDKIVI